MAATYGNYLKGLIERSGISKTDICKSLSISRPYLYSIFSGTTPPPVPEKQSVLIGLIGASATEASTLYDLAAEERGDIPADIAQFVSNPAFRKEIREQYIYAFVNSENTLCDLRESKRESYLNLRVPCCYQGGKQRVASEIVDIMFEENPFINSKTVFYDLCCGSGAITVELLNRGIDPCRITMLDKSSWGAFWRAIGCNAFDLETFKAILEEIPEDKREIKSFMSDLAKRTSGDDFYSYIILQSCSFGGKQIWHDGHSWNNAFFRDYWEPKAGCVRQSPANPMQPSPQTLFKRITSLVENCPGLHCLNADISVMLDRDIPQNAIVYIDPPYRNTTGYAFGFDVDGFAKELRARMSAPLYISEGLPLSEKAHRLAFGGAKGGISGNRHGKHQEWLSRIA